MNVEHFSPLSSTKEIVALQLAQNIVAAEGIDQNNPHFRKAILDLYAECLDAVSGNRVYRAD